MEGLALKKRTGRLSIDLVRWLVGASGWDKECRLFREISNTPSVLKVKTT